MPGKRNAAFCRPLTCPDVAVACHSLWERACSRRWHIQHHRQLTHRFREQARSHKGGDVATNSVFTTISLWEPVPGGDPTITFDQATTTLRPYPDPATAPTPPQPVAGSTRRWATRAPWETPGRPRGC
ncbi:hypothetical protein EGM97_06905 [Pseudomonas sp. AF32]|nr:hypothetical protein [Pseudomonas sp. AF32]